ncbi:MAG: hypothetical protein FJ095_14025 [Deltaproteobacteria bacterium]|nr:hypothetical protein [Deltaproteobacteria bacterium]
MRLLHLVDRLDSRRQGPRRAIEELALAHPSLVVAGVTAADLALPCEVLRLGELASVTARAVSPTLDALTAAFAPDALLLHSSVNAEALAFVARRRGAIVVRDLRAFHPERAVSRTAASVAPSRPQLCDACFDEAPYFRAIRDAARTRVASLEGAGLLLVASPEDAAELASVGVMAPIEVVADLSDGAALLSRYARGLT